MVSIPKYRIKGFAKTIAKIVKTDRWCFIGCDGDMGEGKSCFTSQLLKEVAKLTKTDFTYNDNLTFERKELSKWVDGEGVEKKGQKPEYSSVLADELISMFFKRNWHDSDQIDGIELLNKCRDRHLCVAGNITSFWDLDKAIYPIITFWVHIHERGVAWVFQKDRNPFADDKWHKQLNFKLFNRYKYPARCHGFLFQVDFDDWTPEDKAEYYEVRNTKRVGTEGQREKKGNKRYREAMIHSAKLIKVLNEEHKIPYRQIAKMIDIDESTVRYRVGNYA